MNDHWKYHREPPAPEPVEVPAAELAAAEAVSSPTWEQHVRGIAEDRVRWVDRVSVQLFVEEYDRRGRALESRNRQAQNDTTLLLRAGIQVTDLERDLARALPVVEAAGAVLEASESGSQTEVWIALDALARAYPAAREPRTGEGG